MVLGPHVSYGDGLEAIRVLMGRYEPKTPGTKRAVLKASSNIALSDHAEDMEHNVSDGGYRMKRTRCWPADRWTKFMGSICVEELKVRLDLAMKGMRCNEVRDYSRASFGGATTHLAGGGRSQDGLRSQLL